MRRLLLSCLSLLLLLGSGTAWSGSPIGTVMGHLGDVYAIGPVGSRQLHNGRSIYTGDMLVTGADSRLAVRLRGGTQITLGADSRFAIQSSRAEGVGDSLFRLLKGVFRATAELKRPGERFEIQTRLATVGLRGTDFWGGFLFGSDRLDVLVLEGTGVRVTSAEGQVDLDAAGEGTTVVAGQSPTAPRVWPQEKRAAAIAATDWR